MGEPQNNQELSVAIEERLQPFITQVMQSYGIPGLAIGIVRGNALVYAQGFGVRNIESGEAITPDSLFHMASISKPFSATAIMQLVEQGKIDLQAPVVRYLSYFALNSEGYETITVQQMLSHSAGMPDAQEYEWHAPQFDEGALERYVRSLKSAELIYPPGEKSAYSNDAYEVLGDLIAKVSGQSFESYIKEHILNPLGMVHSTFLRQEVTPDLATTPHFGMPVMTLEGVYPYNRAHAPSSTLHSSVNEMSHWAIANLNRGEFEGKRILQAQSYEQLWHRYVETDETGFDEATGLSWFIGTYEGQKTISHGGSDPGYNTDLVLLPERGEAVMVMVNCNSGGVYKVSEAALNVLLGLEVKMPSPPIVVPVAARLKAEGMESAIAEYRRLQATEAETYDFTASRFADTCWGAIESRRAQSVFDLLQLWQEVQPDEAELQEMLGWAYLTQGDNEQARVHVQRALELDAENEHAAKMIKQLGMQ